MQLIVSNQRGYNSTHLVRHHTWGPKSGVCSPKFTPYYMSEDQMNSIRAFAKDAPRSSTRVKGWIDIQKDIYLTIWRMIFPPEHFRDLEEPADPCTYTS